MKPTKQMFDQTTMPTEKEPILTTKSTNALVLTDHTTGGKKC